MFDAYPEGNRRSVVDTPTNAIVRVVVYSTIRDVERKGTRKKNNTPFPGRGEVTRRARVFEILDGIELR